ncbi:MAG TPA: FecR domain-containing protein [Rhizomicrobium sp.]|nr:FecR domain-containing protein [Rhizomicrobium sp.]
MSEVGAKEINAEAATWLVRANSEGWGEDDQKMLDAWLVQSPAHRAAYWRLKAAYAETSRLQALRRPQQASVERPRRSARPFLAATAAALVIAGVIGATTIDFTSAPSETYVTQVGGSKTLALRDGTRIELNTATSVRVSLTKTQRTIWLDKGEAFFAVAHDEKRPFVVMVAGHRVTDIGTKFLIRHDPARLEVAVVEGKVGFDSSDPASRAQPLQLAAGDVLVATPHAIIVKAKREEDLATELGWRRGMLIFHHTSLAEAAAEFNRYNGHQLVVGDKAGSLTINGVFPKNDVPAFIRLTQAVLKLHVEDQGQQTVISR